MTVFVFPFLSTVNQQAQLVYRTLITQITGNDSN